MRIPTVDRLRLSCLPPWGSPTRHAGFALLHRVVLVFTLLFAGITLAEAAADPIDVRPTLEVRTDSWVPVPIEEMKRAAGDAAFDRLSDAGLLRLDPRAASGRIALEIALVGPAETVGLTITLDSDGRPTLVSTATISVRGLDHAGIYGAFRHVGHEAADRLAAKLELQRALPAALADRSLDDPERRTRFDAAQRAKRDGRYAESRSGFEAVFTSAPEGGDRLAQMATDELRYGLPLFEARQSLNSLGRIGSVGRAPSGASLDQPLDRAEHLYRQIRAENANDAMRVIEADRAIDEIRVTRTALANARQAQAMSRIAASRMMLTQYVMMEGHCPPLERARDLMQSDAAGFEVTRFEDSSPGGDGDARTYRLLVPGSPAPIDLICDGSGVRVR